MAGAGSKATPPLDAETAAFLTEELRQLDRDRYLAALLSPEAHRSALIALYLFNAETARVRDIVNEPLAGEVRLQWWRDAIAGGRDRGESQANPAARALIATIEAYGLPVSAFDAMLDARVFDLYDDALSDRTAFEGHAGETASALIQLSAMVLDGEAAPQAAGAAGHAGVAQFAAGTLLLMPRHTARGQLQVPLDVLSACGLDRETFVSTGDRRAAQRVAEAMVALGRQHLASARTAHARLPKSVRPAFLPVAVVEDIFTRVDRLIRADGDPRRDIVPAPQWRRQWLMFRSGIFGSF